MRRLPRRLACRYAPAHRPAADPHCQPPFAGRRNSEHTRKPDALDPHSAGDQAGQSHDESTSRPCGCAAVERLRGVAPVNSLRRWLSTTDHKEIGVLYMVTALCFFLVGGVEAMMIRAQLSLPGLNFLSPESYDQVFTMHGTTMIFLVVMPVLTGFGVYLVPLMIGAGDLAFPRLNGLGFWLQFFGGILLYISFFAGGAPDAGWFSYAPLSEKTYSPHAGLDYWALGLLLLGGGTVGAAINFVVTIANLRAPGMTIRRLPLFVWMTLVNSVLILFALPALNAALV